MDGHDRKSYECPHVFCGELVILMFNPGLKEREDAAVLWLCYSSCI